MVLPFVRDLFADVEKLPAFLRVASHLKEGTGRIRVAGLTLSAKALLLVLFQRTAGKPLILIVQDNLATESFTPLLQAFGELAGAADTESIVAFPGHDILPFQNLSPHPEIQEQRAIALWKMATGAASIVVMPSTVAAFRLRLGEYYSDLARRIRRGETFDIEPLVQQLRNTGYTATDVVEMPGEYAVRGGILDVYSPEADRPLRIEFFGDEVESIRKFDPATQRSANPVDEAVLLPLTETPLSDELLGAVHARLSGKRITGAEEIVKQAVRSGGVTVFPGWEFYAPVAGADRSIFDLLPRALVITDEPENLKPEFEHTWSRIEEAHERSGVGNLVRPADLYLSPEEWWAKLGTLRGADVEHLGIERTGQAEAVTFHSQPTPRFHGSVPAMLERVQKQTAEGKRVLIAVPNTGEIERLADIFTEYAVSFRLRSRTPP